LQDKVVKLSPKDFCVNWATIGSNTRRLTLVSWALADLIRDTIERGEFEEVEVIAGVETSGIPIGFVVAEELELPFAIVRTRTYMQKKTAVTRFQTMPSGISATFADVANRKVILVDDVASTGETLSVAIRMLCEAKAKPVGIAVLIDKQARQNIEGVPLKALIRIVLMT
jgi:orotate phosphoribosyltransferase